MRTVPGPGATVADGVAVAWRIHRERVLLAGWGRAILLQLAHPMVARGVAEHSGFTADRWGRVRRLHRTLHAMLALTFGPAEDAGAAAARINAIHDRVHGRLDHAAGGEPPAPRTNATPVRVHARLDPAAGGEPAAAGNSAHDPPLLRWVHATLL